MDLSLDQKTKIVEEIRDTFRKRTHGIDERMGCLPLAYYAHYVLRRMGLQCLFQAGSASWEMLPEEKDDGVSSRYWGYEYDVRRAVFNFAAGSLPEMHCWVVVYTRPGIPEVLDVTTKHQVFQAARTGAGVWDPSILPPDYLWGHPEEARASYHADAYAIKMGSELIQRAIREGAMR